jgi:AhpD family alkylhydroperoxidase
MIMRKSHVVSAALVLAALARPLVAHAGGGAQAAAYQDIEKTLGFVPAFFRSVNQDAVGPWWEQLKTFQLNPKTALTGKVKELIGLAVAAQIPCEYCVTFHAAAAQRNGASQREISEAIAMAATTRHWSTMLNGLVPDEGAFRAELGKILAHAGKGTAAPLASITDADAAYRDMRSVLGLVPTMLARYPRSGIAAAWKFLRSVQLNPKSALSGEVKELIGLGVAAQIPCRYCVVFHTQVARASGASDEEIDEALAMAAITRLGSTLLNGAQLDRAGFRRDVARIMAGGRKASRAASQAAGR